MDRPWHTYAAPIVPTTRLLLGAAFFLIATTAYGAEQSPGNACTEIDRFMLSGGPGGTGLHHLLVCDGSNWQPVLTFNTDGQIETIGKVSICDNGEFLTIEAGLLTCETASGGGSSLFERVGTVIRPSSAVTISTDDFVFGSTSLDDVAGTSDNYRMFFDKSKGAFRAGASGGSQWDSSGANVANFSTAFGSNTIASGLASMAFGSGATASGYNSTAWGYQTIANEFNATAWGGDADNGQAGGTASGVSSTAWGLNTTASNLVSTAWGVNTTASGGFSVAFGEDSVASGSLSTAFGFGSTAAGDNSTAWGVGADAGSFSETSIGRYPLDTAGTAGSWVATDTLFEIGNGANSGARANAVTVLKNGNVGIGLGSSLPSVDFEVKGDRVSFSVGDDDSNAFIIRSAGSGSIVFNYHEEDGEIYLVQSGGGVAVGANTVSGSLKLDVEGPVGATQYCDESGANCFTAASIGAGLWERSGTVVRPGSGVTTSTDDFVFGSPSLDNVTGTDDDNRMFFDKSKGAFRAGSQNDWSEWDASSANVGVGSVAFGRGTVASGDYSMAGGESSVASGYASMAFYSGNAAGEGSVAFMASTASGDFSMAFGYGGSASGYNSFALGENANALGSYSAAGANSSAVGNFSRSSGEGAHAGSYGETSLGRWPLNTAGTATSWVASDTLFEIGNGASSGSRANALTLLKNGKLGLGDASPDGALLLDVEGPVGATEYCDEDGNDCFTAASVSGASSLWEDTGVVIRLTSAGPVQWGAVSTASGSGSTSFGLLSTASGEYSLAFGRGNIASGNYSTTWGAGDDEYGPNTASGYSSTAFGTGTTASQNFATAWGFGSIASGYNSTAWGESSTASGYSSTAWGVGSHSGSFAETSLGRWPLNTAGTAGSWVATDTLFEIGNGANGGARANAVTLLKNGNLGVGTAAPQSTLHVPDGKYLQVEDNNAGAPPAGDCDADTERGRISLDTSNNRIYVCMGAARGWDYATLTD